MTDRPDLAAQLRALADRAPHLEAAQVVGELEALKFMVWTTMVPPPTVPAATTVVPTLNTRAAAGLLGISPTGLRRLVAAGEVPVVRLGRRVLYRRETLERLRAERERNGAR